MSSSRRVAYYTNESFYNRAKGGYVVAQVTEGQAGYMPGYAVFPTVEDAQRSADICNDASGLSRDDVLDIVASSMRQGTCKS